MVHLFCKIHNITYNKQCFFNSLNYCESILNILYPGLVLMYESNYLCFMVLINELPVYNKLIKVTCCDMLFGYKNDVLSTLIYLVPGRVHGISNVYIMLLQQ